MVRVDVCGRLPAGSSECDLSKMLTAALRLAGWTGSASVAVSFVSEKDIRGLNRRWRGIDKPTDVLSFAYGEAGLPASGKKDESDLLGDIIVCPGRVRKQASAIGREFRQELALVVVHGFLHLLGFDHRNKRQEAVMFRLQQEILMRAGYL